MSSDQPFVLGIWRNSASGDDLPVGKRLSLNSQGELQKDVIAPDASHMTVEQFSDLLGLQKIVSDYPNCFFTSGVPHYWEEIHKQRRNAPPGSDDGWQRVHYKDSLQLGVKRTKDCIPNQPGVGTYCVIDFDAGWWPHGELPSGDRLREILIEAAEMGGLDLSKVQMLTYRSSGSSVVRESDGHAFDKGGRHLIFLVKDGADLDRFVTAIQVYLCLSGFAYGAVSSAGAFLRRSILDEAALRCNQPTFMGPATAEAGLRVERHEQLLGGSVIAADTRQLRDPSDEEARQAEAFWAAERRRLKPESERQRACWKSERVEERLREDPELPQTQAEREVLARLNGALVGDDIVHLDDHGWVAVAEILTNPEKYDGETCADPVEPEYGGGRNKAKIFINEEGVFPVINSFAHGGIWYRLMFDADSAVGYLLKLPKHDRLTVVEKVVANCLCRSPAEIERLRMLLADKCEIPRGLTKEYVSQLESNMYRYARDPGSELGSSDELVVDHVYRAVEGWIKERTVAAVVDQVYVYDGTRWAPLSRSQAAHEMQKALKASAPEGWFRKGHGPLTQRTDEAVRCLHQLAPQRPDLFDKSPRALNCRNGEVWFADDGSVALRPHSPESGFRYVIDVDFDPGAESPLFVKTLDEMFCPPERVWARMSEAEQDAAWEAAQDLANFLVEVLSYLLVPSRWIPAWFFFYGQGNDGKSMLLRLLAQLLPTEAVTQESIGRIQKDNHGTARLNGCTLFVDDDLPADATLPDDFLKKFSEAGLISANPKNRDQVSFVNTAGIVLCSNNIPRVVDLSHGMKRRAYCVPFGRSFKRREELQAMSGEERAVADIADIELPARLGGDLPGVLAELVRAYSRLIKRGGFDVPASARAAKKKLFSAHPLEAFIEDKCVRGPECEVPTADFRQKLTYWMSSNGGKSWNPSFQQLKAQMEQLGFVHVKKSDTSYFRGLKLRGDREDIRSVNAFKAAGVPHLDSKGAEEESEDGDEGDSAEGS